MSRFDWLSELIAICEDEHILLRGGSRMELAPAHCLWLDVEDWERFAQIANRQQCRWCAIWATQKDDILIISTCFEYQGDYLVARTELDIHKPVLPSQSRYYPAANRMERHIQDMFGVVFSNHPDERRWTRHQAWPEGVYPLRKDCDFMPDNHDEIPPADTDYPFVQARGSGVYEIPVGPVHAGIIEPGHFRFQAVGETVLNLEERLGYVHKGIEKIAEGRDAPGLIRLAARISGDTTVAHSWAACMALERACALDMPPRALMLRALLAERERIANHLGDIGAICNDVGFAFAQIQFSRLRECWLREHKKLFAHRLLMDTLIPGGVRYDLAPQQIDSLRRQHQWLRKEVEEIMLILDTNPSLQDRLLTTGYLAPEHARALGALGYVGKASGMDYDVRRDHSYAPYNQLTVLSPCYQQGDVAARVAARAEEIRHSLQLLNEILEHLPAGEIATPWQAVDTVCEGLGIVEGWRGEIISYVQIDAHGRVSRFFARDPSWLNWPALEALIHNNIVPDFPVCNKSVNGSYSGHDL